MACDAASDNLFPFPLSTGLLVVSSTGGYICSSRRACLCTHHFIYPAVYPVFTGFVELIGSSHQAEIEKEEKDGGRHLWIIIFLSRVAASGRWGYATARWAEATYSASQPRAVLRPPLHLNSGGIHKS